MTKYRKPILIFLIYALFIIIVVNVAPGLKNPLLKQLTPFIPVKDAILQSIIIMLVIWPLSAIIGGFFMGYLLTPLFLFFHKKIIGKKLFYTIQEIPKSNKFKRNLQAFFPALMTINFGMIFVFSPAVQRNILSNDVFNVVEESNLIPLITLLILICITIGVSMALFSPAWFLLDAGISYSNQEKVADKELPIEYQNVGRWYFYFLKGYAGIGVIASYYLMIANFIEEVLLYSMDALRTLIENMIFFLPLVFYLTISAIPSIILLNITKENRINYVRNWAKKFGITKKIVVIFQEIK